MWFNIILLLAACCQQINQNKPIPLIDIERDFKNMKMLRLSNFSSDIRYVPLESSEELPIRSSFRTDFSEKYILNSDGEVCMLYDNHGHFIKQIGKRGRGPGEYAGIGYVAFINDKIFLQDFYTDDLIEYDSNGLFLRRYKSGFSATGKYRMGSAIMLNDSLIFGNVNSTGRDDYKALIIDKSGIVKKYYKNYISFQFKSGANYITYVEKAVLNRFKDKVIFKDDFNDTLFQIDDNYQLAPRYVFNLGRYQQPLPERRLIQPQTDKLSFIKIQDVFETDNLLFIICDFGKHFPVKRITPRVMNQPGFEGAINWFNTSLMLGLYEKKQDKFSFCEPTSTDNFYFTSGLYNDIDAGPRFMPDQIINDSTLIMRITINRLVQHTESEDFKKAIPKFPERKNRLEFFTDSLKKAEFDNPMFMVVTFKN